MDTSTPTHVDGYRSMQLIPDVESPIDRGVNQESTTEDTTGGEVDPKSPTHLSGHMDQNKLTPVKLLSESAEERRLAGGASDLSKGFRRSNSLPNLSWENINNSLFNPYPTRNKLYIVGNRRHSMSDVEIDYSRWSNRDFTDSVVGTDQSELVQLGGTESNELMQPGDTESNKSMQAEQITEMRDTDDKLEASESNKLMQVEQITEMRTTDDKLEASVVEINDVNGSPILRNVKRGLNISPSTPLGLPRKQLFQGGKQETKSITFGEDVEMLELGENQTGNGTTECSQEQGTPVNRRISKGLRRKHLDLDLGSGIFSRMPTRDHDVTRDKIDVNGGNNHQKGISVKSLKLKHKKKQTSKELMNHKATRKKQNNINKANVLERKQRTIYNYFEVKPKSNNLIVGMNEDGTDRADDMRN